jgi:hypothetical protein
LPRRSKAKTGAPRRFGADRSFLFLKLYTLDTKKLLFFHCNATAEKKPVMLMGKETQTG